MLVLQSFGHDKKKQRIKSWDVDIRVFQELPDRQADASAWQNNKKVKKRTSMGKKKQKGKQKKRLLGRCEERAGGGGLLFGLF